MTRQNQPNISTLLRLTTSNHARHTKRVLIFIIAKYQTEFSVILSLHWEFHAGHHRKWFRCASYAMYYAINKNANTSIFIIEMRKFFCTKCKKYGSNDKKWKQEVQQQHTVTHGYLNISNSIKCGIKVEATGST